METLSEQTCYDILEAQPSFTKDQIYISYLNAKKLYNSKNQDALLTFTPQELKELDELLDKAYKVLSHKIESKENDLEKYSKTNSLAIDEKIEVSSKDERIDLNNDRSSQTEATLFNFTFQEENEMENGEDISRLDTYLTIEGEGTCLEKQEDFNSIVENHYTVKEESPQSVFDKLESNNTIKRENSIETQQFFNTPRVEILDGPFLKKIRESKNIDIETISSTSKVSINYLRAIEENAFGRLPAPVFTRGFIVSYAKALGLDTDKIANSYMALYKQAKQTSGEKTI